MRFFTLLLAATIGLVAAQDLEGQPECAKSCIISAIAAVGCKPEDTGCQCNSEKQAALKTEAAPCMIKACTNPADLIKAQSAGAAQCSKYSATATAGPTGNVNNTSITTGSSTGSAGAASTTSSSRAGAAAAMVTPAAFVMGVIGAMAM